MSFDFMMSDHYTTVYMINMQRGNNNNSSLELLPVKLQNKFQRDQVL